MKNNPFRYFKTSPEIIRLAVMMTMNQVHDPADFVIGVDTHKHTHIASVVDACGMKLDAFELPADATGYLRMHTLAQRRAPGTRIWAIEGAGGYGRGLATHLIEQGERVFEIDRPKRPARRDRAKNDELDVTRAAREYLARREPTELRSRGAREAIRTILRTRDCAVRARTQAINHLQGLVTTAPENVRKKLRGLNSKAPAERCARLRRMVNHTDEVGGNTIALRAVAPSRGASSISTPKSKNSTQNSSRACGHLPLRSSMNPASGLSTQPRSSVPGRILGAFVPKPPLPVWHRFPRHPARRCATGSTDRVTESSIARFITRC